MLFSSTFFLFIFFPAVLVLYYGLGRKLETRNMILLVSSLLFYAWGEPKFVLVMLLSIGMNYYFGLQVDAHKTDGKVKYWLTLMVVFNLVIMGIFKYLGFAVQSINDVTGLGLSVPQIALPIGISFFTFQSISYVIDVYRGHGQVLKSPFDVGLYIAFFPQLIAGPIVRYETIAEEIHGRVEKESDFASGIERFIFGLAKKVVLANQFALIADKAFGLQQSGGLSVGFAWLGAIAYMMQIYFDFGGYSDMAIGLGRMFGFHFNENFNFPYVARSITDFWRRWHISLSTWFRDYVYIPLGGNRVGKWKHVRNIFVVWLLTGIWHGANWTFMAWGVYFGILLIIEKYTGLGELMGKSKVIGHVYTLVLVLFSWVLFRADSINIAFSYIGSMFGRNTVGLSSDMTVLYFKENIMVLIVGALASAPFSQWAKKWIESKEVKVQNVAKVLEMIILAIFFLLAVSFLVKGTYNPFIYFNF